MADNDTVVISTKQTCLVRFVALKLHVSENLVRKLVQRHAPLVAGQLSAVICYDDTHHIHRVA